MITIKPLHVALASAAALALGACGKSSSNARPSSTVTVNAAAGGTLTAGAAALSIPPGALSQDTAVTVREAEPNHGVARIEIEPHGLALSTPARLEIRFDDANAKTKFVDDTGTLHAVEVEDRNHGGYKTEMSHLGEIEVELEHGIACSPACAAGFECDDGQCKAHVEDAAAKDCVPVCVTGQECDDGVCKLHVEVEPKDTGTTCVPSCASGLHCDNGVCWP